MDRKNYWLIFFACLAITSVVVLVSGNYNLLGLAVVGFIQNNAFTASSRSRNSGNPQKHFFIAMMSNSVWFFCNFFLILPDMLKVIENGDTIGKITVMIVYVLWTAFGSMNMMKIMLETQKGKDMVGATVKS